MTQLLIFLALAVFVAVLMRKKRHRPNRNFIPKPISRTLVEIPIIKGNLRSSTMPKKIEYDDFISKAKEVWGDRFIMKSQKFLITNMV